MAFPSCNATRLLFFASKVNRFLVKRFYQRQPNFIGVTASAVWHNRKGFGYSCDGDLVLVTPQPFSKFFVDGYDFSKLFNTTVPDPATLLPRIQGKQIIDSDLWIEPRRHFSTANSRVLKIETASDNSSCSSKNLPFKDDGCGTS